MDFRRLWLDKGARRERDVMAKARILAAHDGALQALVHLRESGLSDRPNCVALAREIAYEHRDRIGESVLAEPFLDPIWFQCLACGFTWLEPLEYPFPDSLPVGGVRCNTCERVFCHKCAGSLERPYTECPCGGRFARIREPNGRSGERPYELHVRRFDWEAPYYGSASEKEIALFFGSDDTVPIAVDPTRDDADLTSPANHVVQWAEMLLENGLYYHADRQLASVGAPEETTASVQWLRARLLMVLAANARERSRRYRSGEAQDPDVDRPKRIRALLQSAVQTDPTFGSAWLTSAQYHLDTGNNAADREYALECARRALDLLGNKPDVLFVLGKALRANNRVDEAVSIIESVTDHDSVGPRIAPERQLALLEQRTLAAPLDVEACWVFGKHLIRTKNYERAAELFTRVIEQLPNRSEGHCGLAQVALSDVRLSSYESITRAHELCQRALRTNSDFGPAHELMGMILRRAVTEGVNVLSDRSDIEHFRRAIELDPTCDYALAAVADQCLGQGNAQEAFPLLERAAALDTQQAAVYLKLAVFYQAMRHPAKRAEAERRAKTLAPHLELTSEYKNRLLELLDFRY